MNGLDVLATVRADPYFNEMPIFCVLTSSRDPRDSERAQMFRISGFFTKASTVEEYVAFFDGLVA
jgi:CheY-like chemotaxis protein